MDNISKMLDDEIEAQINLVSTSKAGSEERSAAIDDLKELYRLRIDEKKALIESQKLGLVDSEQESDKKKRERREAIERYSRLGIAAAEVVLPLIFYSVWMNKGFRFEENGTFTSTTFKGLFGKFKPTK